MSRAKIHTNCLSANSEFLVSMLHWDSSRTGAYGQPKIVLQVETEAEFRTLYSRAKSLGITSCMIHDAGRTQIEPNSATVIGIGPGPKSVIDQITGHLKLY
ncbi:hypothetical protein PCK1_003191 [Pneumocystis canis]|nr:hypothetical protein PCK1_003191 [Pneumocystis canis]